MVRIKTETTDYRKQLRGRILETAYLMFKEHGLKAVKMDDISKALVISKRTLYEIYPNKEDLVFETVKHGMNKSHEDLLANIAKTSGDTMDILTEFLRMRINETRDVNPAMIDDFQLYPKVKEYMDQHRLQHTDRIIDFFKRGQEEGYFMTNLNLEVLRDLNSAVSNYFVTERMFAKYSSRDILCTMLFTFVRGICTDRGIKRIDELLSSL